MRAQSSRGARARLLSIAAMALSTGGLVGCHHTLSEEERAQLVSMELRPESLPASPTNRYADDEAAMSLGRQLFFDSRMSADGKVACVTCHDPEQGFSDPRSVSLGVEERAGGRHSMPVTAAVLHPFLFWDGRVDSAWAQPLQAIEGEAEQDFTRVEVARFIGAEHGAAYEAVFGPLPDLTRLPPRARPGLAAWDDIPAAQQTDVERVFANVGKAIEAYERRLLCADTRFDQWARGELDLTREEEAGAVSFVRGGCIRCHAGPSFSDGAFHALGIPGSAADTGRPAGLAKLLADPFNGAGPYSDDPDAGEARLIAAADESPVPGAFRTASLRGAGQRRFFGHAGHRETLRDFITDVYGRRGRGRGDGDGNGNGNDSQDPLLDGVNLGDPEEMLAFLRTLDCPAPDASLLSP
jgi:cytochrome c peroxidase